MKRWSSVGWGLAALVFLAGLVAYYMVSLEGLPQRLAASDRTMLMTDSMRHTFKVAGLNQRAVENYLLALRNALAMTLITPGFTLTLGIVLLILAILCVILTVPAMLLMAALFLLVANHATRSRLARVRKEPYRPGLEEHE